VLTRALNRSFFVNDLNRLERKGPQPVTVIITDPNEMKTANETRFPDLAFWQNSRIFIKHRDREQILIRALGYDPLVKNAKKRNQAFFSVLLGE